MADQPRSVAEVARLIVRLAGDFKVACGAFIRQCAPLGVRDGFLALVREELDIRGCRITRTDREYDDLTEKGQARPRQEVEAELAAVLHTQTAPPAAAQPSPSAVPAASSRTILTFHQRLVLTALSKGGGGRSIPVSEAVQILIGVSLVDGSERLVGVCSSAQEAYHAIVALANAGAIDYNRHAEMVEVPVDTGAVALSPSTSSREVPVSAPAVIERRGYGHKGANFAGVEGLTERAGRIFLDLLALAEDDGGELQPPAGRRFFRYLKEHAIPYRSKSESATYDILSRFLEMELIRRVGRGAAGSRYEVTANGREVAKRIRALLDEQARAPSVRESAT